MIQTITNRGLARVILVALVMTLPAASYAQTKCDRACLGGIMDQYLAHMLKHDPQGLPLAANINARENIVATALGEGVWKSISAIRSSQYVMDSEQGQIIALNALQIDAKDASMTLRLQIRNRKIAESEIVLDTSDSGGPFDAENMVEPDVLWDAPVPLSRRSTREQLVKIANSYFDGIGAHDPKGIPFSKRCDRYESGMKMTNNAAAPRPGVTSATCGDGLLILKGQNPLDRRFPVVDVERGVVMGITFYQHGEYMPPYDLYLSERFKIVDGKIQMIDAISHKVAFSAAPSAGFVTKD